MLTKFYKISVLFILFFSFVSSGINAQSGASKSPYSVSAVALKGKTNTDVYLSFSTSDPVKFPVPAALKKFQLKMRNEAGDVVFLHNEKSLGLTEGRLTSVIAGVNQHNKLEIQANIKPATAKNDEIVNGTVTAQLRPDLTVDKVNAPAEASIKQPFNVEAVIKELNHQTGAVCNVSLYKGTDLFGTVTGVNVPASGQVSVVFEGVTHSVAEPKEFSVKISSINPGDYSEDNNSSVFSVNFINPVSRQALNWVYFTYQLNKDYLETQTRTSPYNNYYEVDKWQFSRYEYLNYQALAINPGVSPQGTLQSAELKMETEDGVKIQTTVSNPQVYYSDYGYDGNYWYRQYILSVPNTTLQIVAFEQYYYGTYYVGVNYYHWASNLVYTRTINGTTTVQYYNNSTADQMLNADEYLKFTNVLNYSNTSFYGKNTFNINPAYHVSFNYSGSYNDYYYGFVNYSVEGNYDASYTYFYGNIEPETASGTTHPEVSLLAKSASAAERLPKSFSLDQNYPNPFNPSTTIRFALPQAANVILKVYDTAGREVATLVNGRMEAGYQSVDFNAAGLASGLYIYRLQANDFVKTAKMMLMK